MHPIYIMLLCCGCGVAAFVLCAIFSGNQESDKNTRPPSSISARLELDTSQFRQAIEQQRAEVQKLREQWTELLSPPVTPTLPTGTEAQVCADIATRQQRGIAKYGTTVADNPLTLLQWLQHAYEENLDQAIYLRRAIDELTESIIIVWSDPDESFLATHPESGCIAHGDTRPEALSNIELMLQDWHLHHQNTVPA